MNALHMQVLLSLGGSFFQKHIFLGVLKGASAAIFVGQGAGIGRYVAPNFCDWDESKVRDWLSGSQGMLHDVWSKKSHP